MICTISSVEESGSSVGVEPWGVLEHLDDRVTKNRWVVVEEGARRPVEKIKHRELCHGAAVDLKMDKKTVIWLQNLLSDHHIDEK